MKELKFEQFANRYSQTAYRLTVEVKKDHRLIIETYDDNYMCDVYFSDRNTVDYPNRKIFYFAPCKWGNNHYVTLKRKLKQHFNIQGELTHSEYPIVDTPETIRKVMLKWAKQYISKRYL